MNPRSISSACRRFGFDFRNHELDPPVIPFQIAEKLEPFVLLHRAGQKSLDLGPKIRMQVGFDLTRRITPGPGEKREELLKFRPRHQ